MSDRRFVYILRSDADPDRHDVGITSEVDDGSNGAMTAHQV